MNLPSKRAKRKSESVVCAHCGGLNLHHRFGVARSGFILVRLWCAACYCRTEIIVDRHENGETTLEIRGGA
jgi:hypothetical protein